MKEYTRMHSRRMPTGRSLTVFWSLLLGGCLLPGGCLPPGVCVCSGGCLPPGGCLFRGCLLPRGCLLQAGVCSGGCLLQGWGVSAPGGVSALGGGGCLLLGGCGIPACTEADTPPLWTESQMLVKTLPWPNFVAAGKYSVCLSARLSVGPPNWLLGCDVIPPFSMLKPGLSNATTMH